MGIFTLSLLLFGIVSLVQAEFNVEASNNGLIPSTELYGLYNDKVSSEVGGYHKAEVYFKTTIPSVNPSEAKFVCDKDGKMTFNFEDESKMEQVNNWPDKVMLMIPHQMECFGKTETQFYFVGNKTVDAPNK